jgi:hypothetical protein
MKTLARLPAIHRIVCALIALALLAAPLQFAGAAQATAGMAMSDTKCPQKKSCCDMDKPDCAKAQGCFAKCGSAPGPLPSDRVSSTFEAAASDYFVEPMSLRPHASTPLRRPPRI